MHDKSGLDRLRADKLRVIMGCLKLLRHLLPTLIFVTFLKLYKQFAERYEFVEEKGKKSRRLEAEIINIGMNNSSMASAKMLTRNTAKISAGTIRNLLKKK